jgi:hypothetical protein
MAIATATGIISRNSSAISTSDILSTTGICRNGTEMNDPNHFSMFRYDDRYYGRTNPYENDPYNPYNQPAANGGGGQAAGGNGQNYYNSYRGNGKLLALTRTLSEQNGVESVQ